MCNRCCTAATTDDGEDDDDDDVDNNDNDDGFVVKQTSIDKKVRLSGPLGCCGIQWKQAAYIKSLIEEE